ncbi:MAG: hypothetical protein ACP5GX_08965 [Anaerolineae bacterium]
MEASRDIALIFLSLEALVAALIPLVFFSALAYGIYRLRLIVREYLRLALDYAEKAREAVEKGSKAVAKPFIWVHSKVRMLQIILQNLIPRRAA